jgi:DNA-binding CsgD family transcriptional regulator
MPAGPSTTAPPWRPTAPISTGQTGQNGHDDDLAGAIRLYRRLVRDGAAELDRLGDAGASLPPAAATLVALGLARAAGGRLVPVPPTTAIAALLDVRHQELTTSHDALRRAYRDLMRLYGAMSGSNGGDSSIWRALTSGEAADLNEDLSRTARSEVLDVRTAPAMRRPLGQAPRSVAHRVVCDRGLLEDAPGEDVLLASARHAAVRVAPGLSCCVRVADREHLLVWPTSDGWDGAEVGGVYVHSADVAGAVGELFEEVWASASPPPRTNRPVELTAAQWRILGLMVTGLSDAELAAAAGLTVKTVRKHIAAILALLGTPTRFAAGVEAARRGWV